MIRLFVRSCLGAVKANTYIEPKAGPLARNMMSHTNAPQASEEITLRVLHNGVANVCCKVFLESREHIERLTSFLPGNRLPDYIDIQCYNSNCDLDAFLEASLPLQLLLLITWLPRKWPLSVTC